MYSSRVRPAVATAALLIGLIALALVPALASAKTVFNVNTTADNPPAVGQCQGVPGDCSLRQAIQAANIVGGVVDIYVPAGEYDLTIPKQGADDNASGDLNVGRES